jgi:hypothetical protein
MPPAPSQEALTWGYWALGLGIVGLIPCSICGPFALWCGLRANRLGAGALGMAGIVLGALGILAMLAGIIFGLAFFGFVAPHQHGALPGVIHGIQVRSVLPWL